MYGGESQSAKILYSQKLIVIHNTPMKLVSIEYESNNSHEKVKIAYIGILSYGRNILETCLFVSQNVQFELHIGGFGILEPEVKKFAEENENIIFMVSYHTLKLYR